MATAECPTVEQLLGQANRLDRVDQRRLLDALIQLLQGERSEPETVSIVALRELDRDIWNGVDAQKFVDREHQAWGG